jgi:hypothetical protein
MAVRCYTCKYYRATHDQSNMDNHVQFVCFQNGVGKIISHPAGRNPISDCKFWEQLKIDTDSPQVTNNYNNEICALEAEVAELKKELQQQQKQYQQMQQQPKTRSSKKEKL